MHPVIAALAMRNSTIVLGARAGRRLTPCERRSNGRNALGVRSSHHRPPTGAGKVTVDAS